MRYFLLAALPLLLIACRNNQPVDHVQVEVNTDSVTAQAPLLGELLSAKKDKFLQTADAEKIASYDAGLKAVEESGILETALNVGDTAAQFTLKNQNGEPVLLSALLEEGPVVLTWYRGGWCPYCNITLAFLQEKLPEFEAAGAQLVALTPELPDSSLSTAEKNDLSFTILSDVGNVVARRYGVVFKLTDDVAARYQKGFDLHSYNGDETDELPLAATYVIDTDGVIRYAFLDVDYRNRAEPDDILKELQNLESR